MASSKMGVVEAMEVWVSVAGMDQVDSGGL